MKKEYKAHPLMMVKLAKPFLILLLFPVLRAGLQYITKGEVNGLIALEVIFFTSLILITVARWRAIRLYHYDNKIMVKTGLFVKQVAEIEISKLSSVQTERNPFDMLFRAMTFRLNTEAGVKNRPDFEFKLWFKESKELSKELYGGETVSKQHFSPIKIAIMAAATSSAFTGIIVGVPVLNHAGDLLGVAISDLLISEINNISAKIETHFPPVVNTVSLVLLLAYLVSFVYSFLKFINFRLILTEKKLEVRSGFISRIRTAFKRSSVNDVKFEQSPLMLLIKRFSIKVSVGGFGDPKSEAQIIVPCGKYDEIKGNFSFYFPFLRPNGIKIEPKRSIITQGRFLYWPTVFLILTLAVSITTGQIFKEFTHFIFFLTLVSLGLVFYFAYLCLVEYYRCGVILGKNIMISGKKGARTCELYCTKEKIGQIKITRFFMDFFYKTCKLKVTVCSECADSMRVRHLDYKTVLEKVNETFNVDV